MTRAKTLLEAFKWNPNWGIKEGALRKVKFIDSRRNIVPEAYLFKWKGFDMVIYKPDKVQSYWNYSNYQIPFLFPFGTLAGIILSKEEAVKMTIKKFEKEGIDRIKDCLDGREILNPTIEYIQ